MKRIFLEHKYRYLALFFFFLYMWFQGMEKHKPEGAFQKVKISSWIILSTEFYE